MNISNNTLKKMKTYHFGKSTAEDFLTDIVKRYRVLKFFKRSVFLKKLTLHTTCLTNQKKNINKFNPLLGCAWVEC